MLPNLSVLWVIFFVLLLTFIVDRLLLRPFARVMKQREEAIVAARQLADTAARRAEDATREFERRTTAARTEMFQQMDEMRREATARRQQLIAETRAEIEQTVADASERVRSDAAVARERLRQDAEALGAEAADRILGRQVS